MLGPVYRYGHVSCLSNPWTVRVGVVNGPDPIPRAAGNAQSMNVIPRSRNDSANSHSSNKNMTLMCVYIVARYLHNTIVHHQTCLCSVFSRGRECKSGVTRVWTVKSAIFRDLSQTELCFLPASCPLLVLIVDTEEGGSLFRRNFGERLLGYIS
jgi:hypothetical protein